MPKTSRTPRKRPTPATSATTGRLSRRPALTLAELPREWVTTAEAAAWVGVGPRTVVKAVVAGQLKASTLNDRGDRRYCRAWLLKWLERRTRTA